MIEIDTTFENRKYGYVRVSDKDQNEARQLEALSKEGISERDIFIDKMSGKNLERPSYQALKNVLRTSDTLFIKELDRMRRNPQEIKDEWKDITQRIGAHIVVLDMPMLDTRQYKSGMEQVISSIILELLSYMAQREREKILIRQAEGIAAAKKAGKHMGRPKFEINEDFIEVYQEWKNQQITAVAAMKKLGLKSNTFYRRVREYENN